MVLLSGAHIDRVSRPTHTHTRPIAHARFTSRVNSHSHTPHRTHARLYLSCLSCAELGTLGFEIEHLLEHRRHVGEVGGVDALKHGSTLGWERRRHAALRHLGDQLAQEGVAKLHAGDRERVQRSELREEAEVSTGGGVVCGECGGQDDTF